MDKELEPVNYEEQDLVCESCGWKGTGADAVLIDFYGVGEVKELRCPNCDTILATIKSAR